MKNLSHCFCELAPLHALGVLSGAERDWVDEQVAQDTDLALELASFQAAVTDLSYGTPDSYPNPQLKAKLFERIGEPMPASEPLSESCSLWAMQAQNLSWRKHKIPGVEVALIHQDRIARTVVGLLRAQPGVIYPLHRHAEVEEIYILRGDLRIGPTVYGAGDYLRSAPGSIHSPITQDGCEFLFRTSLDDEYLETVMERAV